jgi:hypothetical protein
MKQLPEGNKGLAKLPKNVRNKMGYMNKGGVPAGYHRMPDGSIMKNSEHKKAMGAIDYRHGGMVLHTKDNRKK